jgi:hypothetical protein
MPGLETRISSPKCLLVSLLLLVPLLLLLLLQLVLLLIVVVAVGMVDRVHDAWAER